MCDVDMVEEQQLRQLEGDAAGGPPTLPESMAVPLTPGGASSARMYTGPIFARTGSGWQPMLWHVQASPAMLPRGDAMPLSVATPLQVRCESAVPVAGGLPAVSRLTPAVPIL